MYKLASSLYQVQQPTLVQDLHTAWTWVESNSDLFRGEVTKPAFLGMNTDEQQNALKKVMGGQFSAEKDDFVYLSLSRRHGDIFILLC